jgi:glycosyltransferase involved in cell wall biosynthesis
MTGTPVAVVVPAHRETTALATTLTSLHGVQHDGPLTVVVAVDGADPRTVEVAAAHGATVVPVAVRGGSYAARNAALAALPDDVEAVLFTDADCVVPSHWVTAHLEALSGADLSGGAVRFTFAKERPSPAEWVDACRHLKQQVYVERDGFAATCNLAVRAEVVRRHRFDAGLRTGGDAEFCRRVGGSLVYTEQAWVEHPARDLRELRRKVSRLASGVPGQAERWRGRPLPSRRLTRGIWRRAQAAGHDVGPVWGVTACVLDWALNLQMRRAVLQLPGGGS